MPAAQSRNNVHALCHEHHLEMTLDGLKPTYTPPANTATYACPAPDCTVHYNLSDGYFLVADGGQIELDSTPRVKCSLDEQPMYLAHTDPEKRSLRLWKCPQCGSIRTNEDDLTAAPS